MFYNFIIKYADILLEKRERLLQCKIFSQVSTKNTGIFQILTLNFNEMLTMLLVLNNWAKEALDLALWGK